MAQAGDFWLRDEILDDRIALFLDFGDPFGDVQAIDDEVRVVFGRLRRCVHEDFAWALSPFSALAASRSRFIRSARSVFRSEVILPSWCM